MFLGVNVRIEKSIVQSFTNTSGFFANKENEARRIAGASFALRFENQKAAKIKKQALYFSLLFDLFVTSAGFKPATS